MTTGNFNINEAIRKKVEGQRMKDELKRVCGEHARNILMLRDEDVVRECLDRLMEMLNGDSLAALECIVAKGREMVRMLEDELDEGAKVVEELVKGRRGEERNEDN